MERLWELAWGGEVELEEGVMPLERA